MLEVQELTKRFGHRLVVDKVTFKVNSGEIVGYLGPNGAGKSTTAKMIVGMVKPSRGQISINGQRIETDFAKYKMRIGYVPEEAVLYSHLSGYEYLLLVGRLRGIEEEELMRKIVNLLQACSLGLYRFFIYNFFVFLQDKSCSHIFTKQLRKSNISNA